LRALHCRVQGGQPGDPRCYHTATPLSGAGIHLIAALSELSRKPPDPRLDNSIFNALLRVVRDHIAADSPVPATQGLRSWRRAMEYLHDHYSSPLTRESTARALDLHPNYVSYLFRSFGGQSFHNTLEGLRLERSRHLLRNSDLKIAGIAQLCGYSATSYFIRTFRGKFGVTPNQYRYGE
jgi:AraC-like DNA-binding protein